MLDAIQDKLGIANDEDEELSELEQEVQAENVLSISRLHSSILLLDHIHAPSGMVAKKRRIPEFRVRYVVLTRIARLNFYQQNGKN